MNEDIIKLGRHLSQKIDTAKEEIIQYLDELLIKSDDEDLDESLEDEDLEDEEMEGEEFEDTPKETKETKLEEMSTPPSPFDEAGELYVKDQEDVKNYHGLRKVKDDIEKKKEKKGLFGRKKKDPKKHQEEIDKGVF